jgi:LuxR family maltose regulon positive regulatory protein
VLAPTLLATRVLPPPPRPALVARPRLTARLAGASPGAVTVVVAPAGFGKTTLLGAWAAGLPAGEAARVAWLALGEEDAGAERLLRYLIAALQRVDPALGRQALALLDSPEQPEPGAVLAVLANELAALAAPLTLIIDDVHLLRDPGSRQALSFIVEQALPRLHLVLAAREDPPLPLARLRARGRLAELRAADLRFTAGEAAAFLTGSMGLALDEAAVAALEQRTEGWAAGLQLAALALRERENPAAFISGFSGSHRLVLDYLAAEVLDRLPGHLLTFLLQTSILDQLCGPLCDAVLGLAPEDAPAAELPAEADAYSQLILDQIERASLFLVALDGVRGWYRYHHLFSEVLRARLRRGASPAALAALHGRAAGWYGAQGLWREALPHAVAAGRWELAADGVIALGEELLGLGAVDQLRQLIGQLPAAVAAGRPRLLLLQALCELRAWDVPAAAGHLERAAAAFEAAGDGQGLGEALIHLADCRRIVGDFAAATADLRRALSCPLTPRARLNALNSSAYEALTSGYGHGASEALDEMLAVVERSRADGRLRYELAVNAHAPLLVLPGGRAWAERLLRLAAAWDEPPLGPLGAALCRIEGFVALLRGDLQAAARLTERSLAISAQLGGVRKVDLDAGAFMPMLAAACGDLAAADGWAARFFAFLDQPAMRAHARTWGPFHDALEGILRLQQGRIAEARAAAARAGERPRPHEWPSGHAGRLLLHGLVALAEGDSGRAEERLRAAVAAQARHPDGLTVGDARVPLAVALLRAGRPDDALAAIGEAIDEQLRRGTPGLLIYGGAAGATAALQHARARGLHPEAVARLLRAIGAAQAGPPEPASGAGPDAPTARELEVLRLIEAGAGNGEIAERLVISVATVKKHTNNLFAKLDAQSRTQALARARARGLL